MLSRISSFLFTLFSVAVCVFVIGCRPLPQYPAGLVAADSLTASHPDSALLMLRNMEPQMRHESEPVRRYHQLLMIKARDKAFIRHESDSIILSLLRYYSEEGDPRLLPEVCYYAGRVSRDLGDAPQALDYFHQALDAMEQQDYLQEMKGRDYAIRKLQGKIYAQMGYLFRYQHLYDDAINAFEQAYKVDSANRDTSGIIMDIRDIGNVSFLSNQYPKAISLYQDAETLSNNRKDSIRLFELASNIAWLYDLRGDYEKALTYFNKYPIHVTQQNKSSIFFSTSKHSFSCGKGRRSRKNISPIIIR